LLSSFKHHDGNDASLISRGARIGGGGQFFKQETLNFYSYISVVA